MHTIYLAGLLYQAALQYQQFFPDGKLNTLLSYGRRQPGYFKTFVENRHLWESIVLDSGTWTLNVKPEKYMDSITFKGLMAYLRNFESYFAFYFNYDEDFSRSGFDTNLGYQLKLEEADFNPVYVIHDCYNQKEMEYCLNSGHDMVAIGSGELAHASVDELCRIVMMFYNKGIKVHFLGCTNYEKLAKMPVYACDSSTWGRKSSEGYILYWNWGKPGFDKTDKVFFKPIGSKKQMEHYVESYPFIWELEEYLKENFGFRLYELKGRSIKSTLIKRQLVNIRYFVDLQERIREEHKKRGFIF